MATKTFKIGLSNTDKQNMAQDVYERLLALTFPEYDTSTSYSVGDFVVYNDQLYKCIGATTGAWDSTKWQLATLNDLVTDIEDAVQFVNDKANVDGNYPTMTVGVADNLSPYDEESGDDQDEPFNFQATGTGNGSQPDFATGSIALMKEKQGNTVVVNQFAKELNGTNYPAGGVYEGHTSFSNGAVTFTQVPGSGYQRLYCKTPLVSGHKYLIHFYATASEGSIIIGLFTDGGFVAGAYGSVSNATTEPNQYFIYQVNTEDEVAIMTATGSQTSGLVKDLIVIDLTQWFNGDIPADLLSHPENFFRYCQGSLAYNTGTLVNANGRYIKCIGRNQWDEEYLNGYYDENDANATFHSYNNYVASKNAIKVIPNTDYYIKSNPYSGATYILYFDKDGNYLGTYAYLNNGTFTTPANCCYIKFYFNNGSNVYDNNLTISLYYEGESGYDQYYPYELLTNNDTGTETLRSAGSVCDIKLPDGTIKRNVGVVDLSTLDWSYNTTYLCWRAYLDDIKNNAIAISDKYNCVRNVDGEHLEVGDLTTYWQWWGSSGQIAIRSDDAVNSPTGNLFYELATPTTEQGTPYSENVAIDDFGSMEFSGTNGVPQGNLIFYPVDYKAFIDTLYNYTDGTPSNIALKSDVNTEKSARMTADSKLEEICGGVLRNVLAVKESLDFDNTAWVDLGTLNWEYRGNGVFTSSANSLPDAPDNSVSPYTFKILCSKYKIDNKESAQMADKSISSYGEFNIRSLIIKDTTYTDATAFKNAMRAVVLAYEKASE